VRIADKTGDAALLAAVRPPLVRAHLLAGRLREALALSEQALAAMPADPGFGTLLGYSPYLHLEQLRANLPAFAGRWPEAASGFERMIAVAREHGHQTLAASASSDCARSWTYLRLRDERVNTGSSWAKPWLLLRSS
jgi:hypothetical protein